MTREIPILFNTEMVNAILDGRKTQTRRPIKGVDNRNHIRLKGGFTNHVCDIRSLQKSPFGKPGDVLAVREACRAIEEDDGSDFIEYKADGFKFWPFENSPEGAEEWIKIRQYRGGEGLWVPSIHMPKSACRLKLKVKRVWVERVNDISEDAAFAEGAAFRNLNSDTPMSYKGGFARLWHKIYNTWHENPWVWCCEFEVQ